MNIFEGSRRIAKLSAALIVIAFGIAGINVSPNIYISYEIATPSSPPVRTTANCSSEAEHEYGSFITKAGTRVSYLLCFPTTTFKDGKKFIPFKVDKEGMMWGNTRGSSEVSAYAREYRQSFTPTQADEIWAENQKWPLIIKKLFDGLLLLFLTLLIFGVFVWATGWIVRGFMGIPRGQDSKPNTPLESK